MKNFKLGDYPFCCKFWWNVVFVSRDRRFNTQTAASGQMDSKISLASGGGSRRVGLYAAELQTGADGIRALALGRTQVSRRVGKTSAR